MPEKRKFIRFQAPFSVRCVSTGSLSEVSGRIQDISYAGLRALLDAPAEALSLGKVFVFILFPEGSLRLYARTVWLRNLGDKREIGLCFENINETCKGIIYNRISIYTLRNRSISNDSRIVNFYLPILFIPIFLCEK